MKCTCLTQRPDARHPTQPIFHWNIGCVCYPTRRNLHKKKRNVHGQRKKLASPNARDTNMLVFLALGDAEVLSFALGDAKVPNARYFAFWWNIGLIQDKQALHMDDGNVQLTLNTLLKWYYEVYGHWYCIFMGKKYFCNERNPTLPQTRRPRQNVRISNLTDRYILTFKWPFS